MSKLKFEYNIRGYRYAPESFHIYKAVSYTHLDVYKRQWQHRAESNIGLTEDLGLTREEHETFLRHGREALGVLLEPQRCV